MGLQRIVALDEESIAHDCYSGMSGEIKRVHRVRRSQQERSAATRAALLEACARQVAKVGYAATTTSAVAAEAGVSRGALQYTFQDRSDLMIAVVQEGYERLVDDLRRTTAMEGTVASRVASHVEAMLKAYGSPYALAAFEILLGERGNPDFMAGHAGLLSSAEAELDAMWLESFADSGATDESVLTARRVARAAVLGLVGRSLPLGDDQHTAAAIARAVTALLDPSVPVEGRPSH